MISRRYLVCIILASLICIFIAVETVPNGDYKAIAYDLSIGFIVSAIFYWLVVYLPESHRKEIIHTGLNEQYDSFRSSCINTFLILSSSQGYPNKDALLDQEEFKRYFKNNNERGENRWDAVANGLQAKEFYLREIVRMESTTQDYDEIKSFCRFLWQIFTGWSWVHGYSKTNLIQEMLGKAK